MYLEVTSFDFGMVPVDVRVVPVKGGVGPGNILAFDLVIVPGAGTIVLGSLPGDLGLGVLTAHLGISPLGLFD